MGQSSQDVATHTVNHTYSGPVRDTPGCVACIKCTVVRNIPLCSSGGDR